MYCQPELLPSPTDITERAWLEGISGRVLANLQATMQRVCDATWCAPACGWIAHAERTFC